MKKRPVVLWYSLILALIPAAAGIAQSAEQAETYNAVEAPIRITITVNGQEKTVEFPVAEIRSSKTPARPGARTNSPPPRHPPPPPDQAPQVKVRPRMPDPRNGKAYRVQVGAFANPLFARRSFDRLRDAGLHPAYERYGQYFRVVIPQVRALDMAQVIRRLGSAGFSDAWLREEY
jgi:cell division septation protein DedD